MTNKAQHNQHERICSNLIFSRIIAYKFVTSLTHHHHWTQKIYVHDMKSTKSRLCLCYTLVEIRVDCGIDQKWDTLEAKFILKWHVPIGYKKVTSNRTWAKFKWGPNRGWLSLLIKNVWLALLVSEQPCWCSKKSFILEKCLVESLSHRGWLKFISAIQLGNVGHIWLK